MNMPPISSQPPEERGHGSAHGDTGALPPKPRPAITLHVTGELQRSWIPPAAVHFLLKGWSERCSDFAAIDGALVRIAEPLRLSSAEPVQLVWHNHRGEEVVEHFSLERSVAVPAGTIMLLTFSEHAVSFVQLKDKTVPVSEARVEQ